MEKLKQMTMGEVLENWEKSGASAEFLEFARDVLLPFANRLNAHIKEKREVSDVCDAAVEIVGMMITDMSGSLVGVNSGKETLKFFNKFLSELSRYLAIVMEEAYGIEVGIVAKLEDKSTVH